MCIRDRFTTILTFEGGTEVLVEVGTNNYISLPRWYVLGEDGTAVIRDWQLNGEIIRKTGITEEKVVPVKTAAGPVSYTHLSRCLKMWQGILLL